MAVIKTPKNQHGIATKATKCSIHWKQCIECGETFYTNTTAKRCSKECSEAADRKRWQQRGREQRQKQIAKCVQCGVGFCRLPGYNHRTCSDECSKANKSKHKIINKHKRRAAKRNAKAEAINPFVVFERDEWQCQACGTDTPKELTGTRTPTSPHLDHIQPLAKGGTHTLDNVQLLCAGCNQKKSAKDFDTFLCDQIAK